MRQYIRYSKNSILALTMSKLRRDQPSLDYSASDTYYHSYRISITYQHTYKIRSLTCRRYDVTAGFQLGVVPEFQLLVPTLLLLVPTLLLLVPALLLLVPTLLLLGLVPALLLVTKSQNKTYEHCTT